MLYNRLSTPAWLSTLRQWKPGKSTRRIARAVIWLPIPTTLLCHCVGLKQVNGISMQPTLNPDLSKQRDLVLFDRFSISSLRRYNRGDIVMVRSPFDSYKYVVKRLLALPGDAVKTLPPFPEREIIIPEGHCWIEGDRSMDSEDSNTVGPIPLALVEARMITVVLPISRATKWLWGTDTADHGTSDIKDRKLERVSSKHTETRSFAHSP